MFFEINSVSKRGSTVLLIVDWESVYCQKVQGAFCNLPLINIQICLYLHRIRSFKMLLKCMFKDSNSSPSHIIQGLQHNHFFPFIIFYIFFLFVQFTHYYFLFLVRNSHINILQEIRLFTSTKLDAKSIIVDKKKFFFQLDAVSRVGKNDTFNVN